MQHYKMRMRLISIGRDYAIENENGEVLFKLDGKVRFARTFYIENRDGKRLLSVREKLLSILPMYELKRDGVLLAIVRRQTLSNAVNAKFEIEIDGKIALKAHGSFLSSNIQIQRGNMKVGSIARKQFTVVDEIFDISLSPDEDQVLLLGIVMSIIEITPFRGESQT